MRFDEISGSGWALRHRSGALAQGRIARGEQRAGQPCTGGGVSGLRPVFRVLHGLDRERTDRRGTLCIRDGLFFGAAPETQHSALPDFGGRFGHFAERRCGRGALDRGRGGVRLRSGTAGGAGRARRADDRASVERGERARGFLHDRRRIDGAGPRIRAAGAAGRDHRRCEPQLGAHFLGYLRDRGEAHRREPQQREGRLRPCA